MRAVILGACGAVGREVAAGVAADGRWSSVVLADLDGRALRELAGSLGRGVATRRVDAADGVALRRLIRGAGVLMNCTTYRLGVPVLKAALAERVDYVDLGGLYNTPRQLELAPRARRAGVRAVIGCGATPGLSNVLVRRAADRLDRVRDVHISFASHRDIAASPGLLDTLLDEFRPGVPRFRWRDGRMEEVAPFDGGRRIRFPPPLGMQEVYYVPHSEIYTLPRSLGDGLREVAVRGTWRPSDMRTLRALARLGLTGDRPVPVGDAWVRPIDVVRAALLADPPRDTVRPVAFYLDVEVVGERDGGEVTIRQRATHPASWREAATGRMTAVPAIVAAGLLGSGAVAEPGVSPPEAAFDPEPFLAEVRRRGVRISARSSRPAAARRPGT
ncbi:MAG TPA: saccharopine dehydrogenase NADP-binding domain-containing protein [Actinomycetota bacterium]|nr:saccharopine dehydrogenase NADP-binding domain-containing protein [Actinomycetota bacterium]